MFARRTKNRARESGLLQSEMLVGVASWKTSPGYGWLYIGLKQIQIEWKPNIILRKRSNRGQETKQFLQHRQQNCLWKYPIYIAKCCCFTNREELNVRHSILVKWGGIEILPIDAIFSEKKFFFFWIITPKINVHLRRWSH